MYTSQNYYSWIFARYEDQLQLCRLELISAYFHLQNDSSSFPTGCWWIRPVMAAVIWHPGSPLLLLPLLLREWGCSHWSHVHCILICCQRSWHAPIPGRIGAVIPLEHHGRAHPLWDWICARVLWCKLCSPCKMVGVWVLSLCCEYHHLAWSWRNLVESHWVVVIASFPHMGNWFCILCLERLSFSGERGLVDDAFCT